MVKLETQKLRIRDHVEADLLPLHSLLSDHKTMYFLPDLQTNSLEDSKENLRVAMEEAGSSHRTKFFFAMIDKINNEYIGEIGFTVLEEYEAGNVAELGYFILPQFWSKGFVTEAAKAVIDFAFKECNVHKLITGCMEGNVGSERVMQKCNMVKEADLKEHVWYDGEWRGRVEYALFDR